MLGSDGAAHFGLRARCITFPGAATTTNVNQTVGYTGLEIEAAAQARLKPRGHAHGESKTCRRAACDSSATRDRGLRTRSVISLARRGSCHSRKKRGK